ncbi:MAG: hypothetical protein LBS86_00720 [Treponema sp.]|jgi:YD repeat-containing protein|nr:hypothetical protein [Treponema sp.]
MLQRIFLAASLLFVGTLGATAQPMQEIAETIDENQAPEAESVPFSLAPLLIAIEKRNISWRPDWNVAIPVDAFALSAGQPLPRAITLSLDGAEYRIAWNRNGALTAFPFVLNNALAQAVVTTDASGTIAGFTINPVASGDEAWELRFIGDAASPRSRARVSVGEETVYFVALQFEGGGISETWYDEAGSARTYFSSSVSDSDGLRTLASRFEAGEEAIEQYHYDSFGNVTEVNSARGRFSALYSEIHQPRYWETREGAARWRYTLQWGSAGRLVRITGVEGPVVVEAGADTGENAIIDDGGENVIDLRYDYTVDAHGNWTERRETRMIHRLGVLVTSAGSVITRTIDYGATL